jgi:hypothetical protein
MWQDLKMTKNNKIFFCTRTLKIYEVAKNNEIDRRMNKENDIKHENNIWENCSYKDLDDI